MVNKASNELYGAVGQRFYFKEVTILVPANWTNGTYNKAKTETYEKANVIIDDPNDSFGDEPYTVQYGQCGQQGQHIHLTPNFLLDDKFIDVYGQRSKVFVHEWGHLRWGLYDEYSEEQPFYLSSNTRVEATRCSKNMKGLLCFFDGGICHECKDHHYDQATGLPRDCVFIPSQDPSVKQSIMAFQNLDHVTEFCSDKTHNAEAPNRQNKMCDNRDALDVILNSSVDAGTLPLSTSLPPTTINIVQRKRRVVCLTLDISSSMNGPRLALLRQAATLFLRTIIEDTAYVGIVQFSTSTSILKDLTEIDGEASREELVKALPTQTIYLTNVCSGIMHSLEVLKQDDGSTEGDELILLTDGQASDDLSACRSTVIDSGARVHTIALSTAADTTFQDFANITDGIFFWAIDSIDSNELVDAFASLTTSDGNLTQQAIQLESIGNKTSDWFNGTFSVDWTVGKDTVVTIIYEASVPKVHITSPSGQTFNMSDVNHDASTKMLTLKIQGIAEEGEWQYSLLNEGPYVQSMAITVTSRAASADVPPITVKAHMDQKTSDGSEAMVIYAVVTQKGLPVILADVTAVLDSDNSDHHELPLQDNGAMADAFRLDGVYSAYFTKMKTGRYSLKVRVKNQDQTVLSTHKHSGVLYIPGYVGEDGNVVVNPPKPPVNHEPVEVKSFSRTATGESFVVKLPPGSTGPPAFPPSKITDLKAEVEGEIITVTWTAPGASYDEGTASRYHIAWSEDLGLLRTNFSGSHHVDPWELRPQDAGSTEKYSFHPTNLIMKNGTTIFVAVVAENADLLNSSISNIEQVVKYVPAPTVPEEEGSSMNVIGIAVGATLGVIAIGAVVGTIICWKKR
ncbi:calcium-activated chloride channel regulator 1-like [Engraulis encrasicolus]|uniref:calcium-activated chloride channel regulator 1-like n=1 Tax=Engraulis encrasicolus TaxID=184585 RepID=UPI002FCFB2A3